MLKLTTKNKAIRSPYINSLVKAWQTQSSNFATKKVVPSTLDKYDVVIIGSNMGAVLARHIDEITKGRNSVFVASSSSIREQHHLRIAYELGSCKKNNYILDTKSIITPFIPHSDGIRVKEIKPELNTVILENDRIIKYNRLVISTGLNNDFDSIPGLKDAIYDQDHPAFSPYDVTGKQANVKNPYYWYNFHGGKCIFYIPEFPIRGEIQEYNFLVAYDQWEANQKNMSQKLNLEFIIVNANDSFSQHSKETDLFLKEELSKRGIKVLYNTKIQNLDKNKRELTIHENNGTTSVEKYDNFYSIIPTKGQDFLQQANLCNEQGLLSVDKHTLQHTKYQNIFGFGDIIDVPTTRSFIGTQEQLNVVRHNVIRSLHGQNLDAHYDGQSKTPLYIGKNKLTFVSQNYFKNSRFNLLDKEGKHICYLRNFFYSHFYQYINTAYYKFAIWGKPYFFMPKTFKPAPPSKAVKETSNSSKEKKESITTTQAVPSFVAAANTISAELSSKYFVIQNLNNSTQTIFKAELSPQQIQEKEAQEKTKKVEQEQKKKEQQLKRESEEKIQREQEEQFRKKREQEELEQKKQQEIQRQKEIEERRVKEQQQQQKLKEEQELQRLQQQQLEKEKQAELEKLVILQKQQEAEAAKQQQQEEEVEAAKQQEEESTIPAEEEQEVTKKRKGRPKKGKKE